MSFTPKPVYLKKAPSDWADNNEVEPQSFMYVGAIEGVESVSPEEIAEAVNDYLTENPPEVGGTVALEDVEGLPDALGSKADAEHRHDVADVDGLDQFAAAVGDGVTNDLEALQEAIDGADRTYTLRAGTYRIEGTLSVPGNRTLTLQGEGVDATVLDAFGGDPWLSTSQSAAASTTLTEALSTGDRTVEVAAAGDITVGQLLVISSTQTMPETAFTVVRAHSGIVTAVDGTSVTIDRPVPIDFDVEDQTVSVSTYDVGHIVIKDLTVRCGDAEILYLTEVARTAGLRFENVKFVNRAQTYQGLIDGATTGISAVRVQEAVDSTFVNCTFDHMYYGVMPTRASHGTTLRDCVARRSRHIAAPTGGAQGFRAVDCRTYECYAGYDSHQGAFDSTFSGCRDYSPEIASKFRGRSDIVRDCTFYNGGIELTTDVGLDTLPDKSGLNKLVDGCHIEGSIRGTSWGRTVRNSYVRGEILSWRPTTGGALILDNVELDLRAAATPTNGSLWLGYHEHQVLSNVTFKGPYFGSDQSSGAAATTPFRAIYVGLAPVNNVRAILSGVTIDGFDHALHIQEGGDYASYRIQDVTVKNSVVAINHLANNKTGGPIWDRLVTVGVATVDPDPTRWKHVPVGSGATTEFPSSRRVTFGTAAPLLGTWAVGDIVENINPAVGSPKGWRCTVAGTPGTWVSTGNLGGDTSAGDHTHDIEDVTGLQTALDGKLNTSEVSSSLTGTSDTSVVRRTAGRIKAETGVDGDDVVNVSQLEDALGAYAEADHVHVVEDIDGLSDALDAKANTSTLSNYVPTTRTVAGKALSSNITLSASDVGAVPTTRTVAGKALSADVTLAKADVGLANVDNTSDADKPVSTATQAALDGKVPVTRTVAGKPLTSDVTLVATDVGALPVALTEPVVKAIAADTWPTLASLGLTGFTGTIIWDHTAYGVPSQEPPEIRVGDRGRWLPQ